MAMNLVSSWCRSAIAVVHVLLLILFSSTECFSHSQVSLRFKPMFNGNYTGQLPCTYLDEHNGRFCVTPEYPNGVYAYFCTVDENWNSAYPYVVGPTFYGVKTGAKVQSIGESVEIYTGEASGVGGISDEFDFTVFPNPMSDVLAFQFKGLNRWKWEAMLVDSQGRVVVSTVLYPGATLGVMDVQRLYTGTYTLHFVSGEQTISHQVQLIR